MNLIKIKHNGHERLITVINDTPFYCSSGHSSGSGNTWFFFGGVLESQYHNHRAGWFIKPKHPRSGSITVKQHFGDYTWDFIQRHGIDKEIAIHRFGDLPKMCISASISGGFWDTEKGRLLKAFLKENYQEYFRSDIHFTSMTDQDIKTIHDPKKVNRWLRNEGVKGAGNPKKREQLDYIHDHVYHHYHYWPEPSTVNTERVQTCTIL